MPPAQPGPQDAPPRPTFSEWLAGVRAEALARGIKPEIADEALAGVEEPLPVILRARPRAGRNGLLAGGLPRAKTDAESRCDRARGVRKLSRPPRGGRRRLRGAGTNHCRDLGRRVQLRAVQRVRPTVAALATLAWDPRRATFFRGELLDALEILNRGDIDLAHMKGSWAGAMGQVAVHAVELSEIRGGLSTATAARDIWSSPADVFASIANYLRRTAGRSGETWGREVSVSAEAARRDRGRRRAAKRHMPGDAQHDRSAADGAVAASWASGSRAARRCRTSEAPASLVSGSTRHFLVYAELRRDARVQLRPLVRDHRRAARRRHCVNRKGARTASAEVEGEAGEPVAEVPGAFRFERASVRETTSMPTVELDDRGLIVACASCGQKNRLAYDRLGSETRCGQCKSPLAAPAAPIELHSSADFDRLVSKSSLPVVVDYWAPWCGPCRMVAPELQKVAGRLAGQIVVVKVNTDELADLGERYGIQSIPTLAVFTGGKEAARAAGARPAAEIETFIRQAMPSAAARARIERSTGRRCRTALVRHLPAKRTNRRDGISFAHEKRRRPPRALRRPARRPRATRRPAGLRTRGGDDRRTAAANGSRAGTRRARWPSSTSRASTPSIAAGRRCTASSR